MALLFLAAGAVAEGLTDASGQLKYALEDGGATIMGYVEEPTGDLYLPSTLDGYPLTGIGDSAFFYCGDLSGMTIPNSVTAIKSGLFMFCDSLTDVTIPNSVTVIDDRAFWGASA